jgi:hypothetical protein
MFGYPAGVAAAVVVLFLSRHAWHNGGDPFVSRFELDGSLVEFALFAFCYFLIVALPPFAVARNLAGPRAFAAAWPAMGLGIAGAVLTIPAALWFERGLVADGRPEPYLAHLVRAVTEDGYGWTALLSGAAFGAVYWWIEGRFAKGPGQSALQAARLAVSSVALLTIATWMRWPPLLGGAAFGVVYWWIERRFAKGHDQSALLAAAPGSAAPAACREPATGNPAGWLRRHTVGLTVSSVAFLTIVTWVLSLPPHEPWWSLAPSSQTLPHFKVIREGRVADSLIPGTYGYTRMPVWSPGGAIIAVDGLRAPVVWDTGNDDVRSIGAGSGRPDALTVPSPAFVSDRHLLIAGGGTPDIAFSVVDIQSGEIVHEEPGPYPGGGHSDNRARSLAVSPDHVVAAVTIGVTKPPRQTILSQTIFYRTKGWSRIHVLENAAGVAFIGDGARFATTEHGQGIAIFETESGRLLMRFPFIVNGRAAFNRDGSMGAVAIGGDLRVFDVADGHDIASYRLPANDPKSGPYWIGAFTWDPLGRFVAFQDDNRVHFWNPAGGRDGTIDERTIEVRPNAAGVAVSPDGSRVAVVNGDWISVFAIDGTP